MPKATNTHSAYVTLIALPRNNWWTNAPRCYFIHILHAFLILLSYPKKNTTCLNHKYRFFALSMYLAKNTLCLSYKDGDVSKSMFILMSSVGLICPIFTNIYRKFQIQRQKGCFMLMDGPIWTMNLHTLLGIFCTYTLGNWISNTCTPVPTVHLTARVGRYSSLRSAGFPGAFYKILHTSLTLIHTCYGCG